jgi:hypothetical protein
MLTSTYIYVITTIVIIGKVGIPRQFVITKDKIPSTIPYEVTKAGLKLPLGMSSLFLEYIWSLLAILAKSYWHPFNKPIID